MAWVKQWDWCVFGRAKKGLKSAHKADEKDAYQDEYHRPREKVCLLHLYNVRRSSPASSFYYQVLPVLERPPLLMSLHARPGTKSWRSMPGAYRPRAL